MEADRVRWDDRYAGRPPARPERPEALADRPALVEEVPSSGRALDLACGTGAVGLWLAERGLDVVAIDVSPRAIGLVRRSAAELALDGRITARVVDLDDGIDEATLAAAPFDVVVCQRFRDRRLYAPIVDLLAPGGLAVVTVLSSVGLDGEPGDFHAEPGELSSTFAVLDVEVLLDREADGLASIVVRRR